MGLLHTTVGGLVLCEVSWAVQPVCILLVSKIFGTLVLGNTAGNLCGTNYLCHFVFTFPYHSLECGHLAEAVELVCTYRLLLLNTNKSFLPPYHSLHFATFQVLHCLRRILLVQPIYNSVSVEDRQRWFFRILRAQP